MPSIFVSRPNQLSSDQQIAYDLLAAEFRKYDLIPRTLGLDEQPLELPVNEVVNIARECSGAAIMGFAQRRIVGEEYRLATGTTELRSEDAPLVLPTDWNHLEAGVVFGLGLPIIGFKENGVTRGFFDRGAVSLFIHQIPMPIDVELTLPAARRAIERWATRVREYEALKAK